MNLFKTSVLVLAMIGLSACESDEEKAERHFESAKALLAEGDVARAMVEFRNVFENDEGHKEARLLVAGVHKERGETRRAIANYLRVVEQYPEDFEGLVNLAELAAFVQSWDEAERHGRASFEMMPDDVDAQVVNTVLDYRQALLDQDNVQRAEVLIAAEGLTQERPDSVILRNILVDGYNWQGDFEAALVNVDLSLAAEPEHKPLHFSKLSILGEIGDEALIEEHLRRMATEFPDDEDIQATLIRFLIGTGDLDGAETFFRSIVDPASDEIGPYVAFIRFLVEARGSEAAIAEIASVLDTTTQPGLLRSIRAGMLFDAGQRDEAIVEMEEILSSEQGVEIENQVRVALARMLLSDGNEVGARRRVEEVLEVDPQNVEGLKLQAGWMIEADQTDAAIAALRSALSQDQDDVEALTLLAQAYTRSGSRELARDTLAQATASSGNAPRPSLLYARALLADDRLRPAERVLVDSLRQHPDDLTLLSALGGIYTQTGDFGRAEGVRQRFEAIGSEAAMQEEARLRLAILSGQEQTEELLATLESMAASDGGDSEATILLIRTRLANGENDIALRLARQAAEENPESAALQMALAATLSATGDRDAALAVYQDMIANGSASPGTWRAMISTLLRDGQQERAIADLEAAVSAFPEDPELLWMWASYRETAGDIDGAIEVYEQLYALNSSSPVIANNLASLLATWRSEDQPTIERAFAIAQRLRGTEVPAFQDTYGWLLHLRGESAEAVTYLEPASAALAADPIVQFHLAMAYLAEGQNDKAAEQFARVLEVGGSPAAQPMIEAARAELEKLESAAGTEDTDAN